MVQNKRFQLLMTAVFGLFLCLFGGMSLARADDLPPGVIVGDDNGIKLDAGGKYLIEHNDIKPGITFKKVITISNYSQEKEPFDLRLAMKKNKAAGEVDLLEAITVSLKLEDTIIYEGTLSGQGVKPDMTFPLYLGKYAVGDTKVLTATFKVSSDLPKEQWKQTSEVDFYWLFQATKEEAPKDKPKPPPVVKPKWIRLPQTGEEWTFVLMGIIIGVFFVMISLIIAKKKRNTEV